MAVTLIQVDSDALSTTSKQISIHENLKEFTVKSVYTFTCMCFGGGSTVSNRWVTSVSARYNDIKSVQTLETNTQPYNHCDC